MEFSIFLKSLLRYKYILIGVPLLIIVITFFFLRNLPDNYKSSARIATGLIDRSDEFINSQSNIPESKINQEFSNIIQMMTLKKIINQVSYQLMINDLANPASPYRKASKMVNDLSSNERNHAINIFKQKYQKMEELSLWDDDEKGLQKLLVSMKYDYKSLTKNLNVYRLQMSDYIHMEFESENPQLSAFVLNFLSTEAIKYYTATVNQNKDKALNYLDSSIHSKQAALNEKKELLKAYKIKNHVLDVNEQASVLMNQIADFQSRRQEAEKNISAYSGALRNIDSKLDPKERQSVESSLTSSNQDILSTKTRLNALNDEYIKSSFDPRYKPRIDSLQNALAFHINESNNKATYNTSTAKQDLVKEKMNYEINLEIARNSVSSLNGEVNNLTGKLNVLAPNQANIQSYEKDIENETKELNDLTSKYDQTRLETSFSIRLRQVETAMPEAAEPSKKIFLVLLAGIISFMICVIVFFFLFYIDHTINNSNQLADRTQQSVIGILNLMTGATLDPVAIWDKTNDSYKEFKSQLRSIRFEIDNDLNGSKLVAITSLQPNAGKTFLALNLAHAYKMINKRILLIDGNFETPQVSETVIPDIFIEDYLVQGDKNIPADKPDDTLLIMGNKGQDVSLLELSTHAAIEAKLKVLQEQFDIILVEIPSLDEFNKAREWISFCDKVIAVFGAGQNIDGDRKKEVDYLQSLDKKLVGWVLNKVNTANNKQAALNPGKKVMA